MKIFLNSGNPHKMEEFRRLFENGPLELEGLSCEVEETGASFVENALIKAREGCERTGLPTLADDSGLAVDGLGGRPGVHSARYGGEKAGSAEKIEKLLGELSGVPSGKRTAAFHCALALVFPDEEALVVEGICRGSIALEPAGGGGFGYDPVFFLPELGKTFSQLSEEEKNSLSHRGRAARLLLEGLKNRGGSFR